jgi:hypothetical protein
MLLNHPFFTNNSKALLQAFVIVLCIMSGAAIALFSIKKALVILALIIGLILIFVCITNYKLGYAIAMGSGFTIFILSRYFMGAFPVGWIVELLIYASFLGLLTDSIIKRKSLVEGVYHPITVFFVLYLLFIVWQVFNPEMYSVVGWFNFLRRQMMVFFLLILTAHIIVSINEIKWLLKLWFMFALISSLYAILTQIFGMPAFEDAWVMGSSNRQNLYYLMDGFKRKYSLYTDPAAFGMDMAVSTLILGILLFTGESKKKKRTYLLLALICMFGAIFSGTRTAYLMIVFGIFLFLLMRGINRNTFLIGLGFVVVFIAIMIAPVYNNLFINRIRSTFNFKQDASLQVRNINREKIQPYIHANPFGGGVNTSGGQGKDHNPGHYLAGFPPDSGYLRAALETGWIGLILLLLFHFVILRSGIYSYFHSTDKWVKKMVLLATTSIFSLVIANYGQEPFGQIPSCFLFCICVAIIVKSDKISNNTIT